MNKETTIAEMLADYNGATGAEWMAVRVEADRLGRMDLVEVAIDQATAAYETEE